MEEANKEWVYLLPTVQETVSIKQNYQKAEWKHKAEFFKKAD